MNSLATQLRHKWFPNLIFNDLMHLHFMLVRNIFIYLFICDLNSLSKNIIKQEDISCCGWVSIMLSYLL